MSPTEKKTLIRRDHPDLSVSRQCSMLKLSRSSLYYTPVGMSAETLGLMKAIDKVFTAYPFFGNRQIAAYLRRDKIVVGRHRVRRLMAKMGLEAVYRRANTSRPHPQHPIYPYLLRNMTITRPNQVWCSDITFIPVRGGFLYLVAIPWPTYVCLQTLRGMDWATRKVLSWQLSNSEPFRAIGPSDNGERTPTYASRR